MAEISLNSKNLGDIMLAFEHYFPENIVYKSESFEREVANKPFYSREFNWANRERFTAWVNEILKKSGKNTTLDEKSGGDQVRKVQAEIASVIEKKAPEQVEATTPDEQKRAAQKAELEKREASAKESAANAKRDVEAAIKRQQEIYKSLRGKNVYRKVTTPTQQALNSKQSQSYQILGEQALANPEDLTKELSREIQQRVKQTIPEGNDKELEDLSISAATSVVKNLRGKSPAIEAATDFKLTQQRQLLDSIDPNLSVSILNSADTVAGIEILKYYEDRRVLVAAFGEEFADNYLGPRNLSSLEVEFSPTKQDGYEEYELSQVSGRHLEFLNQRNEIFGYIKDNGTTNFQTYFLRQTGLWIESQIPKNALLSKAFDVAAVRSAYNIYVLGEPLIPTSLLGRIAIETGHGPLLAWVGESTGTDLGVTTAAAVTGGYIAPAVAAAYYATTAQAIATTGGVMASEAFLGGAGTAMAAGAGAAAGAGTGIIIGQLAIPLPVVGAAIGAVAVPLISKLINGAKTFVKKHKILILGGAGATIGGIISPLLGGSILLGVFTGGGIAAGTATLLGSTLAITSALSGILGAGRVGAQVVWATFAAGIAGPLTAILIGFPVVVALILIIINSGAYIIPPGPATLSSTNPYIEITKTADPSGQLPSPTSITYTITITAKKDVLNILSIKSECNSIKKGGSKVSCPKEKIDSPETVEPGVPFSFTFTTNYDSKFADSLVTNSITVNASTPTVNSITETGSASVCFGDCPLNCFDFSDPGWKTVPNLESNITAAAATLAGDYPNFAAKVCSKGSVKLCYTTSDPSPIGDGLCNQTIFARHIHNTAGCDINFNQCGIKSQSDALFMLTHEVTHHIQNSSVAPGYERLFEQSIPQSDWPICSYGATNSDPYESMAEGDALFVSKPSWNKCITNFQSQYPRHYRFAKDVMFPP